MSSIKISDLQPAGTSLFQDSESFLNELVDQEMGMVTGGKKGFKSLIVINIGTIQAYTVITANGNTINGNTIGAANTLVG